MHPLSALSYCHNYSVPKFLLMATFLEMIKCLPSFDALRLTLQYLRFLVPPPLQIYTYYGYIHHCLFICSEELGIFSEVGNY